MEESIRIEKLEKEKVAETVEVLLRAFKDEAFTRNWIDLSSEKMRGAYANASRIKLLLSLEADQPMFVAIENQKVIGFVFLEYQNNRIRFLKLLGYLVTNLPMVFTLLPSFIKVFRKGARAMAPAKNLPDNYCTIQAIGVDPQHQGRKVGSRLLHYAHNFCRQHKEAKGIYLFTGDEKNKDIYEKIGYQLLETRDTGGIMSWHLFYEKK